METRADAEACPGSRIFGRLGTVRALALCGAEHAAQARQARRVTLRTQLLGAELQQLDQVGGTAEWVCQRTATVERQRGHDLVSDLDDQHRALWHRNALEGRENADGLTIAQRRRADSEAVALGATLLSPPLGGLAAKVPNVLVGHFLAEERIHCSRSFAVTTVASIAVT